MRKSTGQKVAIFLRRTAEINRFRSILEQCIHCSKMTEALVSSGFFQERGTFSAAEIFEGAKTKKITFVGVCNYAWISQYDRFTLSVKKSNPTVKIEKRRTKTLRWHAKTFIGSINGKPRVGIIGSSNLTRPAAGKDIPFNYEADVVLWYESDREINRIVYNALDTLDRLSYERPEVIICSYEENGLNGNLTLEARLRSIQEEILESSSII
jgi:hypothetical protein